MKFTIEMPEVRQCWATECAYNDDEACHAHAITIGHGQCPGCDTYLHSGSHCHSRGKAGVGACKVTDCRYNLDFTCQTKSIEVGMHGREIRCMSYSPTS